MGLYKSRQSCRFRIKKTAVHPVKAKTAQLSVKGKGSHRSENARNALRPLDVYSCRLPRQSSKGSADPGRNPKLSQSRDCFRA